MSEVRVRTENETQKPSRRFHFLTRRSRVMLFGSAIVLPAMLVLDWMMNKEPMVTEGGWVLLSEPDSFLFDLFLGGLLFLVATGISLFYDFCALKLRKRS